MRNQLVLQMLILSSLVSCKVANSKLILNVVGNFHKEVHIFDTTQNDVKPYNLYIDATRGDYFDGDVVAPTQSTSEMGVCVVYSSSACGEEPDHNQTWESYCKKVEVTPYGEFQLVLEGSTSQKHCYTDIQFNNVHIAAYRLGGDYPKWTEQYVTLDNYNTWQFDQSFYLNKAKIREGSDQIVHDDFQEGEYPFDWFLELFDNEVDENKVFNSN